jgi:hypothetical protein
MIEMATAFSPKKIFVSLTLFGAAVFLVILPLVSVHAASQPQMLITWQAHGSYVPPEYQGKALPNWMSQITASLIVISGGKSVNLQGQTIYWYANDTLIGGGQGMQAISFLPAGGAPNLVALKAELPDYVGGLLIHTVQIPIVQPKAVIEANHPAAQFGNSSLALRGTPYFFNVSDPSSLSYSWSVNGASPAAAIDPQTLILSVNPSTPQGSTFATTLSITDPNQKTGASDAVSLTYVKSL